MDREWAPEALEAHCLAPLHIPCAEPPGAGCQCGFWALWEPEGCARRARHRGLLAGCLLPGVYPVLGLMAGWGRVAIHGEEGFRAQRARVVCLFRDRIAVAPPELVPRTAARRLGPLQRLRIRLAGQGSARARALAGAASHYGIPLLWLDDAADLGVLAELGVRPAVAARLEARARRQRFGS